MTTPIWRSTIIAKHSFHNFARWRNTASECSLPTIYAVATGGLRSALSVIRVSGPQCSEVLRQLGRYKRIDDGKFPKAREATLRKLYDPATSNVVDHGILLWFPGPNSYTGEDCCEFHIHGGPAVITGILKAIGSLSGCRIAEPGEFTKRAFLNGKMDLTEVDGLADLISAETEMQRIQALKQMGGSLSQIYHSWRDRLAKCLANSEAYIDFGEDENIESDVMDNVVSDVKLLVQEISSHLQDQQRGQRLRDGVRIAIVGEPNVGKSTLLNILSGRDAAIVSNIPGTTRDVIESCVNIHGFPVIFADTAGIREQTSDIIEDEGIRRSVKEIESADLILLVVDSPKATAVGKSGKENFLKHLLPGSIDVAPLLKKTALIANKVDLCSPSEEIHLESFDCKLSCKTNQGMETLHELIRSRILEICGNPSTDAPHVTQERYRIQLEHCVENLEGFLEFQGSDLALRTHRLKEAINAIGSITGHLHTEQILDIIFRDFCIGK